MATPLLLPLLLPYSATLPPLLLLSLLLLLLLYASPGGPAWALSSPFRLLRGPSGSSPILASPHPHRLLARLSETLNSTPLMSFSIALTRFIISGHPETAKEILHSPAFADRPLKLSARHLLFERAVGFSPSGEYWLRLRRLSATHFFSPRTIHSSSHQRAHIGLCMVERIKGRMSAEGEVNVREVLQSGSLDSMMKMVFGVDGCGGDKREVGRMVRQGYEVLGEFNWGDHLGPFARLWDWNGVVARCKKLAGEVEVLVGGIIEEHRERRRRRIGDRHDDGDFVDVLLDMEKEMGLSRADMIAVLWVSTFVPVSIRIHIRIRFCSKTLHKFAFVFGFVCLN